MNSNESSFAPVAQLSHLSGYPIRLFQGGELVFPAEEDPAGDVFLCDPGLLKWLETSEQSIVMEPDFRDIFYGVIRGGAYLCVVGPLRWETLFPDRQREYLRMHHAGSGPVPYMPSGSFSKLNDVLRLTAFILNAEPAAGISAGEVLQASPVYVRGEENDDRNAVMDYRSGQSLNEDAENGVSHTPYELESSALKAVENGDEESFNRFFSELQGYSGGNFARNSDKYLEYSAVSMVTLLTRAAIRGGVPQKEAYAVSDLLLNRASQGRGEQDYIMILQEGISQFFRLVKKYRDTSQHSYHIRKCKAYIAANLNQPLSPEVIAKAVGLNSNYMMTLFSSYEGESLMQYVQQERIHAAANMLKYSDQKILGIANYYQFQTQSHFGVAFKKYMGMSPAAYRKKYKPVG